LDRRLIYAGSIPQDLDINQSEQFAMISDGFLAEAIMGQSAWCYGLACAPTSPASMSLTVGRGNMGQMTVVDETNPGTSAIADTTDALMKIGINLTSTTLTFVAPATSGQSQAFLIEGQVQETDTGAEVLPYYNSANPTQPFAGPNNSGSSNNALRTQRVVLQVVSGSPAATGSQTTPAVTSGWVPLYVITISNGTTTLTAGNIAVAAAAPFFTALPDIPLPIGPFTPVTSNTTITGRSGYSRVEVILQAPGGAGLDCAATSLTSGIASGSGGGAGGLLHGIWAASVGQPILFAIGPAGTPTSASGSVVLSINGNVVGTANGGAGGSNPSSTFAAGGGGGSVSSSASLEIISAIPGGFGSDGQAGNFVFAGNGSPSPLGGMGRAGSHAGTTGTGYGSGGGGAYDASLSGTTFTAGNGAPGIALYRFLP
jgi:hypothetical protein